MNPSGTYRGTVRPDMETQTMLFNWSAGGLTPLDSSFYSIASYLWGSATAVNNNPLMTVPSRLYGRIRGLSLAYTFTGAGSNEPVDIEIHLVTNRLPHQTPQYKIIKVGSFMMSDATRPQPSYFDCDIPVGKGTFVYVAMRTPPWVTNPVGWTMTALALIEGVSKRKKSTFDGKNQGLKCADFIFNCGGNNSFADLTRYFWPTPIFNTALITSNYGYHASRYTGYIQMCTIPVHNFGVLGTSEKIKYGVQIKDPDSKKIIGEYQISNDIQFNPTIVTVVASYQIDCLIPIKKGQLFAPFIDTPAWGTNPTNVRPSIILHIRGN